MVRDSLVPQGGEVREDAKEEGANDTAGVTPFGRGYRSRARLWNDDFEKCPAASLAYHLYYPY